MKRPLRRSDRAMPEAEARGLLDKGEYGILSTSGPDGEPYGVPINYCVENGAIYFHSALAGHKLENIAADTRVSFCVVGETEVLPDTFATRYRSVIVSGRATEVFADEKQLALEGLLAKYSAGFQAEGRRYIAAQGDHARVFRITIDTISGKARP
jgi:nitroimidazol reductase NimA-like FMN-containing flavoprotein (pyridoxamine 5'-phosphate oxidase superfamily)